MAGPAGHRGAEVEIPTASLGAEEKDQTFTI